jgi:hypothetical protein
MSLTLCTLPLVPAGTCGKEKQTQTGKMHVLYSTRCLLLHRFDHKSDNTTLCLTILLKQGSIQRRRARIRIVPIRTLTLRHPVHIPTQLVHIQEQRLRATAPHGPTHTVIINTNLPAHCQSLRRSRQLPLPQPRLCPRAPSELRLLHIILHTPVITLELVQQVALLPEDTKSSPTLRACSPKSVRLNGHYLLLLTNKPSFQSAA